MRVEKSITFILQHPLKGYHEFWIHVLEVSLTFNFKSNLMILFILKTHTSQIDFKAKPQEQSGTIIWTQQIDLASNVWLHSSVGRASHWYRGGHGFESRWSPDIFQASSFQLLKLEKNYCDDHSSLSSTTAVQCEFHIYFT